ncbi:MAG TPA: serine hydrolase domain-containing protein [Alloacidobacterium sp.]|nr:serine hydrolase domain-containing protein [Alloacidobacterium sp.]
MMTIVDHERTAILKNALDPTELKTAMDKVHHAGIPGVIAEVCDGGQVWRSAVGVADVGTGRLVTPDMRHRVGSISKTFVAAAVLQQVENGQIGLDLPIGHYLPRLLSGGRSDTITARMLLNHTSGLAEYLPYAYPSLKAFPSLAKTTPESLDDNRLTRFHPTELIDMGVRVPAVGTPGGTPGVYSNTNYQILCQLLESVTGTTAEKCITQNVIERAALRDTELPDGPEVSGPHSQMYESWFGMIDPPRDYSVYDMSWVGPAASLISTVADLNRFYGLLLAGEIVNISSLAQMQSTVPVISFEGKRIEYGLGLHKTEIPGHGTFWGHDGTVWGAGAISMTRVDGKRQISVMVNLMRWNKLDLSGKPQHHPIDDALSAFYQVAMCGRGSTA